MIINMKNLTIYTFAIIFILIFNQNIHGFNEKEAKKVFESRCSICHPLDWALERKKTRDGWKETIMRMKKKTAGNVISDEDVSIITEYLYNIRGK